MSKVIHAAIFATVPETGETLYGESADRTGTCTKADPA